MRTRAPCAPLEMELARPTAKLRNAWLRARTSLWFVPSLLVLASMVLAEGALYVDDSLGTDQPHAWWFFSGNAQGARTILSTIAGSLVSVIALSFSVTMIAIQQAATQFTPRVLKNFTRDRRNQVVLGVYVATFIYALLVLRRVRESDAQGPGFVPGISISIAMLLALVGLAMLIYFIHHVSESLQVSYLLDAIRRDFDRESARLYPEPLGEGIERDSSRELAGTSAELGGGASDDRFHVVRSEEEGYVRDVDGEALIDCARGTAQFVGVDVAVGTYVQRGDPVMRVRFEHVPEPEFDGRLLAALVLDRDRSVEQDPAYAIQQLVDIAVKALSPGINDPTTATQALDHLGGAIARLARHEFPSSRRTAQGVELQLARPDFHTYVHAAFDQIRRAARSDLRVSLHLIGVLRRLVAQAGNDSRAKTLRAIAREVVEGFDESSLTERECEELEATVRGEGAIVVANPG